jgi:hypothetical protein
MSTKTDVPIPADKVAIVMGEECIAWLVSETLRGVQGETGDSGYFLRFDDAGEAERFRERWL